MWRSVMQPNRYHSVQLDIAKCRGCTNCLKYCPTEAIRVRGGRAKIIDERCIDCGECIRICDYHAKIAITDTLEQLKAYRYTICLPAPSLYGQFKNLKNPQFILDALKKIGFDEVFEVAYGADVVSRAIHEKLRDPNTPKPLISSACPTVVRLIQVRFPELIPNIVDIRQPMEVAAMIAKKNFCAKKGCSPEEVGCFFVTPCPAKMTAIKNPIGQKKSEFAGAISMMEIYAKLLPHIHHMEKNDASAPMATCYGIAWAASNGEANSVCPHDSLSVDGIHNVLRVLEEVENGKFSDLIYFEGNACLGGCVGGPLAFENNYVAKNTIRKLVDSMPQVHPFEHIPLSLLKDYPLTFDMPIQQNSVMKLDDNIMIAMQKMERMNAIIEGLPGYDCGSCGSPTCKTFAEDIVRGYCSEMDCIHKLKDKLKVMAQQMVELAQAKRE